jgi:hypothetical protein
MLKAICHCLTCRRLTGSAYTTNILVPENRFKITAGTPKTYSTKQDSGMTLTYSFCGTCGCTVSKVGDAEAFKDIVIVQAGSLDEVSAFDGMAPQAELWTSRRAAWLPAMDGKGQMKEFS